VFGRFIDYTYCQDSFKIIGNARICGLELFRSDFSDRRGVGNTDWIANYNRHRMTFNSSCAPTGHNCWPWWETGVVCKGVALPSFSWNAVEFMEGAKDMSEDQCDELLVKQLKINLHRAGITSFVSYVDLRKCIDSYLYRPGKYKAGQRGANLISDTAQFWKFVNPSQASIALKEWEEKEAHLRAYDFHVGGPGMKGGTSEGDVLYNDDLVGADDAVDHPDPTPGHKRDSLPTIGPSRVFVEHYMTRYPAPIDQDMKTDGYYKGTEDRFRGRRLTGGKAWNFPTKTSDPRLQRNRVIVSPRFPEHHPPVFSFRNLVVPNRRWEEFWYTRSGGHSSDPDLELIGRPYSVSAYPVAGTISKLCSSYWSNTT